MQKTNGSFDHINHEQSVECVPEIQTQGYKGWKVETNPLS